MLIGERTIGCKLRGFKRVVTRFFKIKRGTYKGEKKVEIKVRRIGVRVRGFEIIIGAAKEKV